MHFHSEVKGHRTRACDSLSEREKETTQNKKWLVCWEELWNYFWKENNFSGIHISLCVCYNKWLNVLWKLKYIYCVRSLLLFFWFIAGLIPSSDVYGLTALSRSWGDLVWFSEAHKCIDTPAVTRSPRHMTTLESTACFMCILHAFMGKSEIQRTSLETSGEAELCLIWGNIRPLKPQRPAENWGWERSDSRRKEF